MSGIGNRTEKEFVADFPINFGKGIRGDLIRHKNKVAGVMIAHRLKDETTCATTAFWLKVGNSSVWEIKSQEPLTLEQSIRCSCGLHGWIREGQWEHAPDSIL